MKFISVLTGTLLLAPLSLLAQAPAKSVKPAVKTAAKPAAAKPAAAKPGAAPAAKPKPAAATDGGDPAPVPIARAPVTPAPDPNALKIKADLNPIAHTLTVRCDAPGPTRYEINDKEGRPVLTKNLMAGTTPVVLNVASLPAGPYVVRCAAGDKKGVKLVQLGL